MRRAFLVTRLAGCSSLALLLAAGGGRAAEETKPEATKPEEPKAEEPKAEAQPKAPFAKDADGVAQYIDLVESKYLPGDAEGKNAGVEIKFNLMPAIPRGTTLNIEFEYHSLPFADFDYQVKDDNRRGLTAVWKPKRRLGTGEYFLAARIYKEKQTPAVQKALEKVDGLPANLAPWLTRLATKPIKAGTPEDEAREAKEMCAWYQGMMDKLVENMGEFSGQMKKVKAGEELVSGGILDVAGFKKAVEAWRKKQGLIQKAIMDFQEEEPALFEKSKTTHFSLIELGRMVSKYSKQMQEEVLVKYQVAEKVNPPGHENFDPAYRYKVGPDQLNDRMKAITRQVCPEEKQEEPKEGGEAEKKATAAEGEKAKAAEEEPKEDPPPEPEKPAKKKKKKKAATK
jgi:hypothetical protein